MDYLTFLAKDESDTDLLGTTLARLLPNGTTVALIGTLGAGKTRLVRAVAQGLGIDPEIVGSPTFVLIREYKGVRSIAHFDTYRLRDEDEFLELGPEEYFYGQGLSFIEWADRFPQLLPLDRVEISIDIPSETTRCFKIAFYGNCCELSEQFVEAFEQIQ